MNLAITPTSSGYGPLAPLGDKAQASLHPADVKTQSLWNKIQDVWNRIQTFFTDLSDTIRQRKEYAVISRAWADANAGMASIVSIAKLVTHVTNAMPDSTTSAKNPLFDLTSVTAINIGGKLKLVGGGIAGIAGCVGIVQAGLAISSEVKKGRKWETIDAGLRVVESVSGIGEAIGSVTQSLYMLNAIGSTVLTWTAPLGIASVGLSAVSIVLHTRALIKSKEVLGMLSQPQDKALQDLKGELEDSEKRDGEYYVKRYFDIPNREKYAAQILHVINSDSNLLNPDPAIDNDKRANAKTEMLGALKGRVSQKITSQKLAIAAAVIAIVATIILFLPVLGPIAVGIGLALLGCASGISLGRFIYEHWSINKLEKKLDQLCHFAKIPDDKLPDFARSLRGLKPLPKVLPKLVPMPHRPKPVSNF